MGMIIHPKEPKSSQRAKTNDKAPCTPTRGTRLLIPPTWMIFMLGSYLPLTAVLLLLKCGLFSRGSTADPTPT